MLRIDANNPRAVDLHRRLGERVDLAALPEDLCLVIGGDGWLLASVRALGPDPVYLGLNAGTVGFLLNDVPDLDRAAAALTGREWETRGFPRLAVEGLRSDGSEPMRADVFNDVYVERMTGQTARIRVLIDGVAVAERLVCDGVIVATALGSTGYTFSAGGPACHPLVRATIVTPICPHAPRLAPITCPEGMCVEMEAIDSDRRPIRAVCDGADLGAVASLRVGPSDRDVRLAYFKGHHFTDTTVHKILATRG